MLDSAQLLPRKNEASFKQIYSLCVNIFMLIIKLLLLIYALTNIIFVKLKGLLVTYLKTN